VRGTVEETLNALLDKRPGGATAGADRKMNNEPLSASHSTVCGLAWKRYSRQTPLRDVAPALNGGEGRAFESLGLFARINRGNVLSLSDLLGCVNSCQEGKVANGF
jgi:hypothetical protein